MIAFGDHKGKPAWQEVPGELRATLRRLIVTQGDTEPALGRAAAPARARPRPSLYDLRNLFQVNVEEGRHLWAMVYLLHAYFGRDGREEAEALLERRSGDPDKPRILGAFNEQTPDWLSFFMFTYFTDRDGKYQLASLAEIGLRSAGAHLPLHADRGGAPHVRGRDGRAAHRPAHLRADEGAQDRRRAQPAARIDLPTIQQYLNFHFSVSLDLFGQEASTNAANYYTMGLKGRYLETRIEDDHVLTGAGFDIDTAEDGRIVRKTVPALSALNERLRNDYVEDSPAGVVRWNQVIEQAGIDFELKLPHRAFNRRIGAFAELARLARRQGGERGRMEGATSASGCRPTRTAPTSTSLMGRRWSSPASSPTGSPRRARGINGQPADFEYVRFN